MKGLSFLFLKNSMGANMKKNFRNSCNGEASTSTLPTFSVDNCTFDNPPRKSVTLEDMILQLELEEELARRRATLLQHDEDHRANNNNIIHHRRKSCVNNSDILRSAKNALNQYPRFSLDGKDAMYRSSFRKIDGKESCFVARAASRSSTTSASTVVWCKPGVVAKLMGLEAMPMPVPVGPGRMTRSSHNHNHNRNHNKAKMGCKEEGVRNQNPRAREWRKEVSLEAVGEGKASWQPTHAFL